jgi:hypothetical protein
LIHVLRPVERDNVGSMCKPEFNPPVYRKTLEAQPESPRVRTLEALFFAGPSLDATRELMDMVADGGAQPKGISKSASLKDG